MKTTILIIFILFFAVFLRFLYEGFREQYRQKSLSRGKEVVENLWDRRREVSVFPYTKKAKQTPKIKTL